MTTAILVELAIIGRIDLALLFASVNNPFFRQDGIRRRQQYRRFRFTALATVVIASALLFIGAASGHAQDAQQPQPATRKTSLKYDPVGRVKEKLTQILDVSNKQISAIRETYDYNPVGERIGLTVEELDADSKVHRAIKETYKLDPLNREVERLHYEFNNGVKVGGGKLTHKYDPVGRDVETTVELTDGSDRRISGRKISRKYDPVDNVIEEAAEASDANGRKTSSTKDSMKYDPVGNEIERLSEQFNKDDKKVNAIKVLREYNPIRQEIERTTQQLDAQGNVVQSKTEKIDPAKAHPGKNDEDPNP